jgi:hypothetical protein
MIDAEVAGLFTERFPRYALSLSMWKEEAFHPPEEHVEVLYVYGVDEALALFLQSWLFDKRERRLIFLEPREERIVRFLRSHFAKEILEEKQIEIYHLPRGRGKSHLFLELAERYPVRGIEIVSSPEYRGRGEVQRARLQLLRKTALTHAHFLERLHGHIPFSNLLRNLTHLPAAFYVNGMKDAFRGIPAMICGAGPSLSSSFGMLKGLEEKALIFAGGSAIGALSNQGIAPHFAVAIDPNPDELERLKNCSFALEVPFLFSCRLFPDVFATSKGPFGYMRSGMAGLPELWFEEELGLLNDEILGASLPAESLSVTMLSAAVAHHLGCDPILFDGLDLAYTGNKRYTEGVNATCKEPGEENVQPVDRSLSSRDRFGKKITSAVRWIMESDSLSLFAKRCKERRWINCTAGGLALKGIESMPLSHAIQLFDVERDLRKVVREAIAKSPMPASAKDILPQKIEELKESIKRVIEHLDILILGKCQGLAALSEIEIKEELAYQILFYGMEKTCTWKEFRELGEKYLSKFPQH